MKQMIYLNLELIIMLNENYNILVTGSNGQLGSEIKELSKEYDYNFFFTIFIA